VGLCQSQGRFFQQQRRFFQPQCELFPPLGSRAPRLLRVSPERPPRGGRDADGVPRALVSGGGGKQVCSCSAERPTSRTAIFPCRTAAQTCVSTADSVPKWCNNATRWGSSGHARGRCSRSYGLFEA